MINVEHIDDLRCLVYMAIVDGVLHPHEEILLETLIDSKKYLMKSLILSEKMFEDYRNRNQGNIRKNKIKIKNLF